ncbi:Uncharacterised protein [Vibrio cholerae]|nr:Uncharacterised protein [Vibrio cholerae]
MSRITITGQTKFAALSCWMPKPIFCYSISQTNRLCQAIRMKWKPSARPKVMRKKKLNLSPFAHHAMMRKPPRCVCLHLKSWLMTVFCTRTPAVCCI